jgi:hypothetical protein
VEDQRQIPVIRQASWASSHQKKKIAKHHFFHTNQLILCFLTQVTFVTLTSPDYLSFQAFHSEFICYIEAIISSAIFLQFCSFSFCVHDFHSSRANKNSCCIDFSEHYAATAPRGNTEHNVFLCTGA